MANNNTRTMAFQIPEDLFQRIKAHLERETQRTGKKYTQREFVLGLIEEALNGVEAKSAHSVFACGENCVCSLASPSPAGAALLGSGRNPDRLASEKSSQTTGEANDSPCEATAPEVEDLPPEKQ